MAAPRIDVIAPSGALLSREAFEAGLTRLRALGCAVRSRVGPTPWLRFADTDEGRLEQIHAAAHAGDVDLVMIARGGYGLSRLLDRIDWPLVAESVRRGVRWMGFSDFTAFQAALLATTGAPSWAGPTVSGDFGHGDPEAYTLAQFLCLLQGSTPAVEWAEDGSDETCRASGHLEGTLWGGNLAMLASLAGTAWLPRIEGGILFLEDVGEHPYRVERMLLQLLHGGVLARQRVVLLGSFTGWSAAPQDNGFDLATVARYVAVRAGIPVVTGLPFGHVRRRAVLGFGLRYRLECSAAAAASGRGREWRLCAAMGG